MFHTFQGGGTGIAPLRFFVFLLFLFVASKILAGSQGIPHFELWTRLGSSFSSSYFSFSSSSSPFPSTKVAGGRGGHFLDPNWASPSAAGQAGGRGGHFLDPYWASPSAAGQPRFNLLVAVPPPASPYPPPHIPFAPPPSPLPPPPPPSPSYNPPCVCLAVCKSHWGRGRFALAVKSGRGL